MSLSFPGLISAVPLYAVDHGTDGRIVRQWMSDGGISSNFPIHFFDRLLPSHPTFGINLQPLHPTKPQMVERPRVGQSRISVRMRPLGALTSFAGAILDTMQNWADTSQATLKGYADRVVEVRQTPVEGGLNLRMPEDRILTLAHRGKLAGEELATFDWDANRIARYRIALTRLTDALDHLQQGWTDDDWASLIEHYDGPGRSWLARPGNRQGDIEATGRLVEVIQSWAAAGYPALARDWPKPSPDLRMSPR